LQNPDRLLIRAPNWLGDAVMALPALAAIRAALPGTHIAVAAIGSVAPIFYETTAASPNQVLTISDRSSEVKAIGEEAFDAVLLLPNSFRSAWNARRAAIRERWGFATSFRGFLLTRRVAVPRRRLHQSAYYLALVRGLGFDAAESIPRMTVRPETAARASELLAKSGVAPSATLVGFAPGAAYGHAKRWPPARVAEVVTRVSRERGAVSVLVGAHADRDAGREIESSLPVGVSVVNLIGRTDLRQLAGVLARCSAFVSNDSGAMHLAAAVGVPVTAIFGPTDERVTAPLGDHDVILREVFCRPCMLRDCPIDHRCMKRITSDEVFETVAGRLSTAGSPAAQAIRDAAAPMAGSPTRQPYGSGRAGAEPGEHR
jgi:lipopolysaccharide heptosyltransferase II